MVEKKLAAKVMDDLMEIGAHDVFVIKLEKNFTTLDLC